MIDSTALLFYSDYDGDGVSDTLFYYLSSVSAMSHTSNTEDRMLYRRINSDAIEIVSSQISAFKISYFDEARSEIPVDSLVTNADLNTIRGIEIEIVLQASELTDGNDYALVSWKSAFYPSNLAGLWLTPRARPASQLLPFPPHLPQSSQGMKGGRKEGSKTLHAAPS